MIDIYYKMDIIDRLPVDIVRYIIPFTYKVQPKALLEQIKSHRKKIIKTRKRMRGGSICISYCTNSLNINEYGI